MKNFYPVILAFFVFSMCGTSKKNNSDLSADTATEMEITPLDTVNELKDSVSDILTDLLNEQEMAETVSSGCDDIAYSDASDIKALKVVPENTVLEIPLGEVKDMTFKAIMVYKNGDEKEIKAAFWSLSNIDFGSIDNSGIFTSAQNSGGETFVIAKSGGLCGSAYLRVVQTYKKMENPPDANIEFIFSTGGEPKANDAKSPILLYPPDEAMAPADFFPITPQWLADSSFNAFELRFESKGAKFSFFGGTGWKNGEGFAYTLPQEAWSSLFIVNGTESYSVKIIAGIIEGSTLKGSTYVSGSVNLHVTTVKAGGAFYYWRTIAPNGDIRVLEMEKPPPYTLKLPGGGCLGCHSVSPEGDAIAVSYFFNMGGMGSGFAPFTMKLYEPLTGKTPVYVHADAKTLYEGSTTILPAFSAKYWTDTDKRIMVPVAKGMIAASTKVMSINLLTGVSSEIVKGGDTGQHGFPAWSPNGEWVVYTTGPNMGQGFAGSKPTYLYRVAYNDGAGGIAVPLAGASDPDKLQFYPCYSPDGKYVVFNVATEDKGQCQFSSMSGNPSSSGGTYDNCLAELFVVPSEGGTAIRLDKANGPNSPGVANSWPTFGITGDKYYWVSFSSRRDYGFLHKGKDGNLPSPQVFIAAIDMMKLKQGVDGSFSALWLPNQDINQGNHLARWAMPPR
jgi:hypothetical protein